MRLYSVKNFTELENKTEITLGKTLASGGAGQIKLCEQDTGLVAKVYHENVDTSLYEQKLEAMLKNPPLLQPLKVDEKIFPQLSWPSALIIDKNNSFVGYLMPRMSLNSSVSLERFLQKRMRRHEKLPEYYGHRINIAYNLSTIVEALHMKGHYKTTKLFYPPLENVCNSFRLRWFLNFRCSKKTLPSIPVHRRIYSTRVY